MARKPTGRPPGRPKTAEETVTVLARIPRSLGEQVKRYAARHRCSVAELIRDGLEMRLDAGDVPGRTSLPMSDNGDTGIQEISPLLRAAIAATVRETLDGLQNRPLHTVLTLPHGEHGNSGIHKPVQVLQKDTGESQHGAEALEYDASKFYLGKLCPKGHMYEGSGQSLLRKHNNACRECENAQKREKRARQKAHAAQSTTRS